MFQNNARHNLPSLTIIATLSASMHVDNLRPYEKYQLGFGYIIFGSESDILPMVVRCGTLYFLHTLDRMGQLTHAHSLPVSSKKQKKFNFFKNIGEPLARFPRVPLDYR